MAENPISGGRAKHIDVRYLFIRELVKHKVIDINRGKRVHAFGQREFF